MEEKIKEKTIFAIEACGHALINNAEKIIGGYEFMTDLNISITINARSLMPTIEVHQKFTPEEYIEERHHEAEEVVEVEKYII